MPFLYFKITADLQTRRSRLVTRHAWKATARSSQFAELGGDRHQKRRWFGH